MYRAARTAKNLSVPAIWAHQVITGPIVAGDAGNLRRVVRRIFAMELLLVVTCLGTAHALLNLDWIANGTLGAAIALAGGVVAVAGCAFAWRRGGWAGDTRPPEDRRQ